MEAETGAIHQWLYRQGTLVHSLGNQALIALPGRCAASCDGEWASLAASRHSRMGQPIFYRTAIPVNQVLISPAARAGDDGECGLAHGQRMNAVCLARS